MQRFICATALLGALFAVGCNNSSGGSNRGTASSGSTATPTPNPTPSQPSTPQPVVLHEAHGELIAVPTSGSATTLAFRVDGETDPREIADVASLTQAGARVGTTFVADATVLANHQGATALTERVELDNVLFDDVDACGRLQTSTNGAVVFISNAGQTYEIVGPLSADVLSRPLNKPLRVTGRIDPNHVPYAKGAGLEATSCRHVAELSVFTWVPGRYYALTRLEDLEETGSYRHHHRYFTGTQTAFGTGRLPARSLASIAALVSNADLCSQPSHFPTVPIVPVLPLAPTPVPPIPPIPAPPAPTPITAAPSNPPSLTLSAGVSSPSVIPAALPNYAFSPILPNVPHHVVTYTDLNDSCSVRVDFGARPPVEVRRLLTAAVKLREIIPTVRSLERGQYCAVGKAGVYTATPGRSAASLWKKAFGPLAQAPSMADEHRLIGAFMGKVMGGGHAIAVTNVHRLGNDLYVEIARTFPAPGSPQTMNIPTPFDMALLDTQGIKGGALFVDGKRVRSFKRLLTTLTAVPVAPTPPPFPQVP